RSCRRLQARPAERVDPGHRHGRDAVCLLDRRRRHHRGGVRAARPGTARRERDLPARLHDDPGRGAAADVRSGAGQPRARSRVSGHRPPHRVRVTSRSRVLPRALRHAPSIAGVLIVAALLLVALAAPWLSPFGPTRIFPGAEMRPPSSRFLLGTDEVGRDILSRVLYGARVSLGVAIPSVALAALAGTTLGVGLGYTGGAPDLLAMRLFDVLFAFPPILLAIALVAALGPSTLNLIVTIAVLALPQFAVLAGSRADSDPRAAAGRIRPGGARPGRAAPAPPRRPGPAQSHAAPRRPGEPEPLDRHPGGGGAELSRARHPAARAELGQHAQPRP